jgi:hypothetical protein
MTVGMNTTSLATVLVLGLVGIGCAEPGESQEETSTQALALTASPCTPAVIVIRHAEDVDSKVGEKCDVKEVDLESPGGPQRVHQRCLTPAGKEHANLYATHLSDFAAQKNLCPIGSVVTQDPWTMLGDKWPSANPFETIRPFANAANVNVTFLPPKQVFDAPMRRSLLGDAQRSVVIAWDSEGMAEQTDPLLSEMNGSATPASSPTRDKIYVFTNMNRETAKFDLTEYTQFFKDSSGYFERVVGTSFSESSYYRFYDGSLKSKTAYSPDLLPSDMLICRGTCDGTGKSLFVETRR